MNNVSQKQTYKSQTLIRSKSLNSVRKSIKFRVNVKEIAVKVRIYGAKPTQKYRKTDAFLPNSPSHFAQYRHMAETIREKKQAAPAAHNSGIFRHFCVVRKARRGHLRGLLSAL